MQKPEKISIVICADLNLRASIAVMRALRSEKVDVIIGVSNYISAFLTLPGLLGTIKLWKKIWFYTATSEQKFVESLANLGSRSSSPLLFFPMGEKVLRWVIKNKENLKDFHITVPSHRIDDYERVSNKESFLEISRNFKLDTPEELSKFPEVYSFPYVIKARKVSWGISDVLEAPVLVRNESTHQIIKKKNLRCSEHIYQNYIDGPSFYYCALFYEGNLMLKFVQQTIIQQPGGKSVVCAVPSEIPEEVRKKIDEIFKSLKWSGALMVELKYFSGKFYIIECNPRLWGPLQCSVDNGVNFPLMLYKMMSGNVIEANLSNEPIRNGFIWLWGLIDGLFYLFTSGTAYQVYPAKLRGVRFKDVWFRLDSMLFFLLEPFILLLHWVLLAIKFLIKKFISRENSTLTQ